MNDVLAATQKDIHYRFQQVKYLWLALTHASRANEGSGGALSFFSPSESGTCDDASATCLENNERLEFLGDAVLELSISEVLYARFPDVREGELTRMRARLVNMSTLADLAKGVHLDRHVLLGRGEEQQGGRERKSLLADTLEALIGAIFLDAGFATASRWVRELYRKRWPDGPIQGIGKDPKSQLQEVTQERFKDRPVYVLEGSDGPEHAKTFIVRLTLPSGDELMAQGPSVKRAEQTAAAQALDLLAKQDYSD